MIKMHPLMIVYCVQFILILFNNAWTVKSNKIYIKNVLFIVDGTVSMIDFKDELKQTIGDIVYSIEPVSSSLIVVNDPGNYIYICITIFCHRLFSLIDFFKIKIEKKKQK